MSFLFEVVLILVGLQQSVVTIYRGSLIWARRTVDNLEAYAEEHEVPYESLVSASSLAFGIQASFTVLYWLSIYALVFR